jgi:quinol monooxygenase YgiN
MSAASNELHGTARQVIHDGKLEEFKRLTAQCVEIVRTRDTGTLEYRLFLNADGTECVVHERYRDSAAGLEHMANIGPMMKPLSKVCTTTGEVCGTPSPELREALEKAGVRIYAPFQALSR